MEPFLVFVAMPVAIGALAEFALRDARRASFAAATATLFVLAALVQLREPGAGWHWVAALPACPLPIAVAVGTAMFLYGRIGQRY